MAWIKTVKPEEATGLLKRQYEAAVKRVGKVFQIIEIQCLRPKILRASTQLYLEAMYSPDSSLSRIQREMIENDSTIGPIDRLDHWLNIRIGICGHLIWGGRFDVGTGWEDK